MSLSLPHLDTATLLRRGVLVLAALGIAGTTTELVFLRHWQSATQLIVWPAVVMLGLALLALAWRPTLRRVRIVRWIALIVVIVSALGVVLHFVANLDAGPLDRLYASSWATMSAPGQWWAALTGGVGPAPTLAPAALAEISLALLLATIRHPLEATATT